MNVADNLASVRDRIAAAVRRRGEGPDVTLIGVTKRQPRDRIVAALEAGLRDFGENYAQALRDRIEDLHDPRVQWHFIGALQSNKVKIVVGRALIHTVDRPSLIAKLQSRAASEGLVQDVLVQVHIGDEASKAGVAPADAAALLDGFAQAPNLRCRGLMTIPPPGDSQAMRASFRELRELRDRLASRARTGVDLAELSMGMSADFEVAIEQGATMVRVGTAIFGPRVVDKPA